MEKTVTEIFSKLKAADTELDREQHMAKLTREKKIEWLARIICKMVNIEPMDSTDGSSNWWMFFNDAEKIIADLESRGFGVWDWIDVKDDQT